MKSKIPAPLRMLELCQLRYSSTLAWCCRSDGYQCDSSNLRTKYFKTAGLKQKSRYCAHTFYQAVYYKATFRINKIHRRQWLELACMGKLWQTVHPFYAALQFRWNKGASCTFNARKNHRLYITRLYARTNRPSDNFNGHFSCSTFSASRSMPTVLAGWEM